MEGLSTINSEALTGGEKTTYPYPLAQPDTKACARSLNNGAFSKLGFCRILHSDRGSAFVSPTTEITKYVGTRKTDFFQPDITPWVIPMLQQFSSVTSTLQTCVQDVELQWDKLIDTVMMALRSTSHSATGFTPIYSCWGVRSDYRQC